MPIYSAAAIESVYEIPQRNEEEVDPRLKETSPSGNLLANFLPSFLFSLISVGPSEM